LVIISFPLYIKTWSEIQNHIWLSVICYYDL
jgi:hypothetical protein